MPESVSIQYGDLFEFLEDYRAGISQLQYTVPVQGPVRPGDEIALQVGVPVLEEVITLYGEVAGADDGSAAVRINPEAGDGMSRLEGFYRFVGQVVESMLVSGRFQVTGQWAAGGAAAAASGARRSSGKSSGPVQTDGPALHSGDVSERSITELLMELYRTSSRGMLEIRSEEGRRVAYVDKGGIVQWASDPIIQDECLGVLLARAKKIDQLQLRKSLELMNESGQQQGQCLIDMGVLTFPQLVVSLMTQVEVITRTMMRGGAGTFAFHPMASLPKEFITPPMKAAAFLFAYYRKRFGQLRAEELDERIADVLDSYTVLSKDINIRDMKLKKPEARFLEIVGAKSYRFREIFTVSNMGRATTLQTLLTLIELDMLDFVDGEDVDQRTARLRKQLATKLQHMEGQNPFDILEVHWTSLSHHVESGYQSIRTEYEKFGRGLVLPPEAEAARKKILARIDESYEAIKDKHGRAKVREEHFEPQQHEFSADLLFKQGEMLMVRGEWDQVVDGFERACELMPREGKYKQMLAVAKSKRAGG